MRLIDADELIEALDSFILDEVTDVHGDTVREILERLTTIEERKTGNRMNDPITNADRIRTMTDEELAEMFERWITNCDCNFTPCVEYCDMFDGKTCKERWLVWLKKAVEK